MKILEKKDTISYLHIPKTYLIDARLINFINYSKHTSDVLQFPIN